MNPATRTDADCSESALSSEMQAKLADLLDEYLQSCEQGVPLDTDALLARHSELEAPLRECLEGLALMGAGGDEFRSQAGRSSVAMPAGAVSPGRLGDYEIIREIGRGGMGIVYEAYQISLSRKVALKVLPFAAMLDHRQTLRFQNEARAAAQLQHPHIVPIHGVGSERGVQYYAMQYIEGRSVREALEELRASGPRGRPAEPPTVLTRPGSSVQRLSASTRRAFPTHRTWQHAEHVRAVVRLCVQVAEALHAAHECGVIHRDVKPSNLMLDEQGKVWITDFGLARIQTDANLTRSGDIVGTLHYMSPEQATGQAALVDHRTDVYSLGVTLYELLTLERPIAGDDPVMVTRRIQDGEVVPVRNVNPAVAPDLGHVVAKAMAVAREDRYATADALADDLRRYLAGKPTMAQAPPLWQRVQPWVRKHRRAAVAAGIMLCLVSAGLVVTTLLVSAEKIKTDAALATTSASLRNQRRAIDHFVRFGARAAEMLADVPGTEHARKELLQDVVKSHQEFVQQADGSLDLVNDVAISHDKMAELHQGLGEHTLAVQEFRSSERLLRGQAADRPQDLDSQLRWARSLTKLAGALGQAGEISAARATYRQAIEVAHESAIAAPGREEIRIDLATSWNNLGQQLAAVGVTKEAASCFREAVSVLTENHQLVESHEQADVSYATQQTLATVYDNLGQLTRSTDTLAARQWGQRALAIRQQLLAEMPDNSIYVAELARTYNRLAALKAHAEENESALADYREAVRIQRDLLRESPRHPSLRRDLAVTLNNQGLLEGRMDSLLAAQDCFTESLQWFDELAEESPANVPLASRLGGVHNNRAVIYQRQGKQRQAEGEFRKAIQFQSFAHQQAPDVQQYRSFLSRAYANFGRLLRATNRPEEAAQLALKRRSLWPTNASQLHAVAVDLAAACAEWEQRSQDASPRWEQFSLEAVRTLRQVDALGWPAGNVASEKGPASEKGMAAKLWENPAFAALPVPPILTRQIDGLPRER